MRDTVWEQITTEGSVLLVASPDPLACTSLHNHRPRPLARVAPPAVGSRVACMLATPAACSYAPRAARAPVCALPALQSAHRTTPTTRSPVARAAACRPPLALARVREDQGLSQKHRRMRKGY